MAWNSAKVELSYFKDDDVSKYFVMMWGKEKGTISHF